MIDFIKLLDLPVETKSNEISNLFNTNSTKLKIELITLIQKHKRIQEFLKYYNNQDCKSHLEKSEVFFMLYSKMFQGEDRNTFNLVIIQNISVVSKVMFLYLLIQKNKELLNNLLINISKHIIKFFVDCRAQKNIKEKLKSCLNNKTYVTHVVSRRYFSRRTKKENTMIPQSILSESYLIKFKHHDSNINSNKDELRFSNLLTQKKKDGNNVIVHIEKPKTILITNSYEEKLNNIKNIIRCNSSLISSKMKFEPQQSKKKKSNKIENNININILKINKEKKLSESRFLSKKIYSFKNKKNFLKKQLIGIILDHFNCLYKKRRINSKIKKLNLIKKLHVSDKNNIIDNISKYYKIFNYSKKNLKTDKIQTFLTIVISVVFLFNSIVLFFICLTSISAIYCVK
jgi:hypothetical protein